MSDNTEVAVQIDGAQACVFMVVGAGISALPSQPVVIHNHFSLN
jgi:hypothetical protein